MEAGKAGGPGPDAIRGFRKSQTANTNRNRSIFALAKDPDCLTDPKLCISRVGTMS